MSVKSGRRMSDFGWASVAQYVTYVEGVARLTPISDAQIYNFPYGRTESHKLLAAKKRTKARLEGNLSRLASWVGERGGELDDNEKVVLRTFYKSIKASLEIVSGHIKAIDGLMKIGQTAMDLQMDGFAGDGGDDDDLQF